MAQTTFSCWLIFRRLKHPHMTDYMRCRCAVYMSHSMQCKAWVKADNLPEAVSWCVLLTFLLLALCWWPHLQAEQVLQYPAQKLSLG